MPLPDYLAGRRPRPHPEPDGGRWTVAHRHAEGGEWSLVRATPDEGVARDDVASPVAPYGVGDLLTLTAPRGGPQELWVVTPDGPAAVPPPPADAVAAPEDWFSAWDGAWADTRWMLRAAGRCPRPRVVRAAHACAADAAWAFPMVDPRTTRALAVALRWADGERPDPAEVNIAAQEVYAARDELRAASYSGIPPEAAAGYVLAMSAAYTLEIVRQAGDDLGTNAAEAAAGAGRAVARRAAGGRTRAGAVGDACRAMAPLVRAVLPLSDVLLARALAARARP